MSADDALLEELVFQVLERHESGDSTALDELCAAHPQRAQALRARVESLARSGLVGASDALPESLGEFRVVRRLGQGGMGVVLLAEQPRLGRRVALKMVRPEQLFFRGARERFQREVEAIARLSHPGIVSIYTVGEAAGAPYFAMELVAGASLHEVLLRLRERAVGELRGVDLARTVAAIASERGLESAAPALADPLFAGSWNDACVWLAREVAQALEHAHQRGVLHRDVKPSNILITPQGRVLLTDFGLASTAQGERITREGAQMGSLAYMAPEQLAGKLEAFGPRTDVFGLGVTLYEALALELPWQDAAAAVRRFVPLRARRPSIPADFELACATALDPDPLRRYASAAHFARDLTNLLERRPIEARPVGAVLALRRWAQRQPVAATTLVLGLAAAVAGPLVYGAQEARAARELAAERDVAQSNLAAALDAIELTLEKVGHRDLRDIPRVDKVKRELLESAGRLYAQLATSSPDDPRIELRSAIALGKLGRLRRDTGDSEGAARDWRESEDRLRALLARSPDDIDVLLALGNLLTFSVVLSNPASSPQAVDEMVAALEFLRRARELEPGAYRPNYELARGLLGLAHLQDLLRRSDDAEAAWKESLALAEPLLNWPTAERGESDKDGDLELYLTALGRLNVLAQRRGELEQAKAQYLRLIELSDPVAQPSAFLRHMRSTTFQTLAGFEPSPGEPDQRAQWRERAHAELSSLAAEFPGNVPYTASLALSFEGLAEHAATTGDTARRLELLEQTERWYRRLQELSPRDPRPALHLGNVEVDRARVARAAGDLDLARARLLAARDLHRESQRVAGRIVYPHYTARLLNELAELARIQRDHLLLAEVGAELVSYEDDRFVGHFDTGQVYLFAHDAALEAGESQAADEHVANARKALEAALAADALRASLVANLIENSGLAQHPELAELFARAQGR